MGKAIFMITMIVFIDLLLIMTGQLCSQGTCSMSTILFNAMIDFVNFQFSDFWNDIVGLVTSSVSSTGWKALLAAAGVTVGAFLLTSSDMRLFIPIALTLGLISADFVYLFTSLGFNTALASIIIVPFGIAYVLIITDWLRGKD